MTQPTLIRRPRVLRVLDAYCCIGGAARGYQRAGFHVTGVDIRPMPDYCGDRFVQGDAIEFIRAHGHEYDFIHTSPPCQGEGAPTKGTNAARNKAIGRSHPRLITPTRAALEATGRPYVMENVSGSEVGKDITLCGEMFGLGVLMHRHFELGGWSAVRPAHPAHRGYVRGWRHGVYRDGPYVAAYGKGGGKATVDEMRTAKGIDWSTDHFNLREALPPRLHGMGRGRVPRDGDRRVGGGGMSATLYAALDAAERGWAVFPLRPGDKRPALHGESACPGTGDCAGGHRKWEDRATTDPDRIRRAWAVRPFNIGIAAGPSGLVVIDLDMPKAKTTGVKGSSDTPSGVTTFTALCERAGHAVPTTYRVRTASGGQHLYFTTPPDVRLTNTAGTVAPLVDTRASGGYVVAAGSTTPAGPYEALCGPEAAALPGWLLSILQPAPKPVQAPPRVVAGQSRRYADVAFDNEVRNVATAGDGTRNATLLRAARALGRFIASGDLTRIRVEDALRGAAGGNATQSQRYYDDVIRRALDWSITHNSARGRAA